MKEYIITYDKSKESKKKHQPLFFLAFLFSLLLPGLWKYLAAGIILLMIVYFEIFK